MFCPFCGMRLPDESNFCQYCGSKLSPDDTLTSEAITTKSLERGKEPFYTHTPLNSSNNDGIDRNVMQEKVALQSVNATSRKNQVALVCISILLVFLAGLNVIQYNSIKGRESEISDLSSDIKVLEFENNKYRALVDKQETQIETAQKETEDLKGSLALAQYYVDKYNIIVESMKKGALGFAANNFKTNESIVVIDSNDKNKKITLTANWPKGGSVSVKYDSLYPTATIAFDQVEWKTSTKLSIIPNYLGVSVATFSNDVNNQTFDIILIVK